MKRSLKTKLQNEKAITLIALVVTIVILIILATISIGAVFGENGLIEKAQKAKELHEQKEQEEIGVVNLLEEKFNEYKNMIDGSVDDETFDGNLRQIIVSWSGNTGEATKPESVSITLKKNGVKIATTAMNAQNNWRYLIDEAQSGEGSWQVEVVDIPEGYTVSKKFESNTIVITFTSNNNQGGGPTDPGEPTDPDGPPTDPDGPEDPV